MRTKLLKTVLTYKFVGTTITSARFLWHIKCNTWIWHCMIVMAHFRFVHHCFLAVVLRQIWKMVIDLLNCDCVKPKIGSVYLEQLDERICEQFPHLLLLILNLSVCYCRIVWIRFSFEFVVFLSFIGCVSLEKYNENIVIYKSSKLNHIKKANGMHWLSIAIVWIRIPTHKCHMSIQRNHQANEMFIVIILNRTTR